MDNSKAASTDELQHETEQSGRSRSVPHRAYSNRAPERPSTCPTGMLIASAIWTGLLTGLLEVLILVIRHHVEAASTLGALQMNRHFPWMIPVTLFAIFGLAVLPFAALARVFPEFSRKVLIVIPAFLCFMTLLLMIKGLMLPAAAILAFGLGWRVMKWIDRPDRLARQGRLVRWTLPAFVAIVALLGGICYQRLVLAESAALNGLPAAAPGSPNVLLLVLDTLRADRLGLAGYHRPTTPNLDRLAKRGVVFGEARSAAPWTFPSHATMFTGRWPHELKINGNRPLDATYPTLAEVLSRKGYATAGFVGNTYYCNSWFGLGRGFAHYEDYYEDNLIVSPLQAIRCAGLGRLLISLTGEHYTARPGTANALKDAPRVNHDFLEWLDGESKTKRPFFAFLNYIDVHDPYATHTDQAKHFGRVPRSEEDFKLIQNWHASDKKKVTPEEISLLSDSYDDCLSFLDENLGRLFDDLERRGILRNTLVFVTSDHGEGFGEHGLYLHGQSLYRQEVHVPLIMLPPGSAQAGRLVTTPVSARDIPATVADYVGFKSDHPFPGSSLTRFWTNPEGDRAEEPIRSEVAIVERVVKAPNRPPSLRGPMASVISEGFVYIRDALGKEELFDIAKDRAEARNLAGSPEFAPVLERLRKLHDAGSAK